ncbi:MAG: hypothetical protein KF878_35335 [Planctomycetes bacterium]|nr:hypothetical protein [Planctomycetota bacterium]
MLAAAEASDPCQHPLYAGAPSTQAARAATDAARTVDEDVALAVDAAGTAARRSVRAVAEAASGVAGLADDQERREAYETTSARVERLQIERLTELLLALGPPERALERLTGPGPP